MMTINPDKLLRSIEGSIKWHEENKNDPYNIDNAVIIALEAMYRAVVIAMEDDEYEL